MTDELKSDKPAKKRRGFAQIIERGKDVYLIRVFLGRDSNGKRHFHNETFRGKKRAAEDRARELYAKHKTGEPLKLANDTLNAFLDEWLASNQKLKESSKAHYKRTLDYYVRPTLGGMLLTKIEAADIQNLYNSLLEHGLSRNTVVYVHTLMKGVFKLAVRRRKIVFNPMDGVESPGGNRLEQEKKETRASKVMTQDQMRRFLDAAKQTRFETLYTLAFHSGCRPGELLGLKWDDLDVADKILTIRQAINWRKTDRRGEPEWYLDTPKTAHGRRVLRLADSLIEMLADHRKAQLEERMKMGKMWNDHGFIFCDQIGEPYSQSKHRYYFKQILEAADLPEGFSPFSARHTSATFLMAQGVNAKTVSERLGHSDVRITLQTYTHPNTDMQIQASDAIEQVIMGKK